MRIKNQSGQSLVSVLVAAGVGAVVMGFLTDMMVQQGISQKFLSQKLEINDLTNNLIATLSKANNCTCQFVDNDTNPNRANYTSSLKFDSTAAATLPRTMSVKAIYAGCKSATNDPPWLVKEDTLVPNSNGLHVDKVELTRLQPISGSDWQGQWEISFKQGTGKILRSVKPIVLTQRVTVDTTTDTEARITGCSGVQSGTGTENYLAKWSATSGLLQDSGIFENQTTKNVGIGTPTPNEKLQIRGALVVSGIPRTNPVAAGSAVIDFETPNNFLRFNTNNQDIGFNTDANGLQTSERLRILSNGNVGIGTIAPTTKLEVNGGIKLGTEPTCNLANEGTQRYRSTIPKGMEFCDGTSWVKVGSSGEPADCYKIDVFIPQGSPWRSFTCNPGYGMLFISAFPNGSEDNVNDTRLQLNAAGTELRVRARDDSWRVLGKCCR